VSGVAAGALTGTHTAVPRHMGQSSAGCPLITPRGQERVSRAEESAASSGRDSFKTFQRRIRGARGEGRGGESKRVRCFMFVASCLLLHAPAPHAPAAFIQF